MEDKLNATTALRKIIRRLLLSIWPNELGCRVYKILVTRAAVA